MKKEGFEKLIKEALLSLPSHIRKLLENVEIVVDDFPSEYQLKKVNQKNKYSLLGLYEGIPKTKRGTNYANVLPDKITIFQKPIESLAKTDEAIKKLVKKTVWHEIAHHFGFNEEEVRNLEKKKWN